MDALRLRLASALEWIVAAAFLAATLGVASLILHDIRATPVRASGAPESAWKERLERARGPIERKRDAHEAGLQELSARWDALLDARAGIVERRPVLDALRERVLERNYINNLLAGIERELSS